MAGIRVPLRLRLTIAFSTATAVLLAAAGAVVYVEVKRGLDGSLDASLRRRAAQYARLSGAPDLGPLRRALAVEGEPAQLVDSNGRVLAASPRGDGPLLMSGIRLRRAFGTEVRHERREAYRLLGRPAAKGRAIVVSTSMVQRERALETLGSVLLFGGPLLLFVASSAGYLVAAGALRPVERMRLRAAEISAATPDARLPLPSTRDELRRLGETLNAMLARLDASARQERAFLANASHELRTPLAILRTEVDIALHEGAREDELREALTSIGEEADRLVRLAEDLLVIARGEDGSLPLAIEAFDLAAVACAVVDRFAIISGDAVRCDIAGGLMIEADPRRLEQALSNLLDNALRHGSKPVTVSALVKNGCVELHVTDRGPGFPHGRVTADALEHVGGSSGGGFGLGLPIVASIARAHGGRAEAVNTAQGVDAWVALPYQGPVRR